MSIEAEDINTRWMDKKSYNMHEDEHKFSSCMWRCMEKEGEDEEECIVVVVVVVIVVVVVKMNMS